VTVEVSYAEMLLVRLGDPATPHARVTPISMTPS